MDDHRYAELLAQYKPAVIETADDHDRMLTVAEQLMEKGESLSPEEERLLALVVLVIDAFESTIDEDGDEEDAEAAEPPKPHETLHRLLESRGLEITDIADIFGTPHFAREALAGTRPITRGQAKHLSKYFRVPEKLFRDA
jgi:antitoxin component HigA of HigAB toxin-antitoxin module